jgi:hypothetical protein
VQHRPRWSAPHRWPHYPVVHPAPAAGHRAWPTGFPSCAR